MADGTQALPAWLRSTLKSEDLERIHQSVEKAEARTSAELVPMIVRRSILTDHVRLILFLAFLFLFWTIWQVLPIGDRLALLISNATVAETASIGLVLILSALFAQLLHELDYFRRHLTTRHDRALSVMHRAQLEFHQCGITHTHGATGVLIFVSLLERRAVILADRTVADAFPENTWNSIVEELVVRVRSHDFTTGMIHAIEVVADRLQAKFPAAAADRAELPNVLIVKE